jgi:hypothetical protein
MPELIDLSGMSDEEAFAFGIEAYRAEFINQSQSRGQLSCHDGMPVVFWIDRYDHAFRTSSDRIRRPYGKDIVARRRIERLNWIRALITCSMPGVVCKEFRPPGPWKRAYYSLEHGHIVWLEPSNVKNGKPTAWRFSTSYDLPAAEIKRTTLKGKII